MGRPAASGPLSVTQEMDQEEKIFFSSNADSTCRFDERRFLAVCSDGLYQVLLDLQML